MWATGPAARSAHATFEFGKCFLNTNTSGLFFFARSHPANPLVAGERRYIVPHRLCRRSGSKRLAQVCWQAVCHTKTKFYTANGTTRIIPITTMVMNEHTASKSHNFQRRPIQMTSIDDEVSRKPSHKNPPIIAPRYQVAGPISEEVNTRAKIIAITPAVTTLTIKFQNILPYMSDIFSLPVG